MRNGFQYFYRVTAFDINSARSGPSSLESATPAKSTIPRKDAASITLAGQPDIDVTILGGDGNPLVAGAYPAIDPEAGTFSGPMPPSTNLSGTFQPFVARLEGARLGGATRMAELNPGLAAKPKPRSEVVRWAGANGEEVEGMLYYPLDYREGRRGCSRRTRRASP